MRAAIALRDVVGEREDVLVIAVVPFQRDIDADVAAFAVDRHRRCNQRRLRLVEILDECRDPAFVKQLDGLFLGVPRIGQMQPDAGIEERQLAKAMLQFAEIELDDLEGGGRWQKRHPCAALALRRRPDDLQRRLGIAKAKPHPMLLPIAPDRQLQPFRECIDHRNTDAVQPARNLVSIGIGVLELPAGVQLGHDDLRRRNAFLGVNPGRNPAAIVGHAHRAVGVEDDVDQVAIAGERLIDGIVRNLEHHVMQPRAIVGIADIHPRPLANGIEPAQHLDRIGVIVTRRLVGFVAQNNVLGRHTASRARHMRQTIDFRARTREGRVGKPGALYPSASRNPATWRCIAACSSASNRSQPSYIRHSRWLPFSSSR